MGRHFEQSNFRSIFCPILVAKRVPKGRHFGSQNGTKIDPKTRSKFKSEKVASWDRLGSIWDRFGGCPGGILGGSWAVLGRSWSDFLSSSIFDRFFDRFWSPKGCPKGGIWGAKTEPKTTQNRSKNHLEKRSRFRSLLRPSWDDLGPILAASWAVLGVKIVLWLQRRSFFQKSTFSNKSGLKTRLGAILGRFGSPKGVVLGGQKGPKRRPLAT